MKKVCVSTYCEWSSYGSVMQTIGLKQALKTIGFESFVVRDMPAPVSKRTFKFVFSWKPRKLIKNILNYGINRKMNILYERSVKFINNHVDIIYYNDYHTLKKQFPAADFYIAGSDQIWHPALCRPAFFLDFLPSGVKKISYAASMGVVDICDEKKETFKSFISKFDYISVREKDMIDVIRMCTNNKVYCHIDPIFLLSSDEWRKYEDEYLLPKPYILVYGIYWDVKYNRELMELHKRTGYDIVAICPGGISKVWANRKIYDAGPGQFLYLIDNAEAVISSSFHGVAFALRLNKKFVAIINPNSPSRISNLLGRLKVKNHMINEIMDFELDSYDTINEYIEEEKENSILYLREVLV